MEEEKCRICDSDDRIVDGYCRFCREDTLIVRSYELHRKMDIFLSYAFWVVAVALTVVMVTGLVQGNYSSLFLLIPIGVVAQALSEIPKNRRDTKDMYKNLSLEVRKWQAEADKEREIEKCQDS